MANIAAIVLISHCNFQTLFLSSQCSCLHMVDTVNTVGHNACSSYFVKFMVVHSINFIRILTQCFSSFFIALIIFIFLLLLCWVRVHWSVYKASYNMSFLKSPSPLLFHAPSTDSWNSFNRYHFCIYIHMYTLFAPYSPTYPFLHHLLQSPVATSLTHHVQEELICPPVFWCCRRKYIKDYKKNMAFLLVWEEDSYAGRFLVLFPCIYVLQPKLVHLC
jgi:hypothetical protein